MAEISNVVVNAQVTIDPDALREAVADALRQMAEEIMAGATSTAPSASDGDAWIPVTDRTGDYGIYNPSTDDYAYLCSRGSNDKALAERLAVAQTLGDVDVDVLAKAPRDLSGVLHSDAEVRVYKASGEFKPYTDFDGEVVAE